LFLCLRKIKGYLIGADGWDTLTAMNNLAVLFHYEGWPIGLNKEVLETEERVLGADHPHTLTSKHILANLYNDAEGWQQAAVLEAHVLENQKKRLRSGASRDSIEPQQPRLDIYGVTALGGSRGATGTGGKVENRCSGV